MLASKNEESPSKFNRGEAGGGGDDPENPIG